MRLHLTLEHFADGQVKVLYAGQEVLLAQKALAASVAEGKAVRTDVFFNPAPVTIRYPKADALRLGGGAKPAEQAEPGEDTAKAAEPLEPEKAKKAKK